MRKRRASPSPRGAKAPPGFMESPTESRETFGETGRPLRHDLDLALGRVEAALTLEDVLQRADRDFELVE